MKFTGSRLVALFLMITLAACGKERPTATSIPTPTSTPMLATAAPLANSTSVGATNPPLPASWTPTSTATKAPTRPPSATPTPAPTLTAQELCNKFSVVSAPANNSEYEYDASVLFGWHGVPADTTLVLTITKHGAKNGLRADLQLEGDGLLPVPLTRLPDEGQYDWKIWLQHPAYGTICDHSGTFTRKPAVLA